MTENHLTTDQIQSLFAFVKSKYVRYIDVQYELVDHLATAIEDEMQKDSKLSFEAALSKVYARFPITGFYQFYCIKSRQFRQLLVAAILQFTHLPLLRPKFSSRY
ncbi:MAG: hypothetical protein IPJ13_15665 [Saprospiraceae bacterium]|nr:hypothetical protein [Saprospiraceae bacterium]